MMNPVAWLKLALIAFVVLLVIAFIRDPLGIGTWWKHHKQTTALQAEVHAAHKTAAVIENTLREEAKTAEKADQGVADVLQLPDAQTPLAPDRRSSLCSALASVFNGNGGCTPDPEGSLPQTDNPDANAGG